MLRNKLWFLTQSLCRCCQESTNYEKTLQLLRKYDPDFAAAEAKQQARLLKQQSSPNRRVRFSQPVDSSSLRTTYIDLLTIVRPYSERALHCLIYHL